MPLKINRVKYYIAKSEDISTLGGACEGWLNTIHSSSTSNNNFRNCTEPASSYNCKNFKIEFGTETTDNSDAKKNALRISETIMMAT